MHIACYPLSVCYLSLSILLSSVVYLLRHQLRYCLYDIVALSGGSFSVVEIRPFLCGRMGSKCWRCEKAADAFLARQNYGHV
jgi:hypothetical protein